MYHFLERKSSTFHFDVLLVDITSASVRVCGNSLPKTHMASGAWWTNGHSKASFLKNEHIVSEAHKSSELHVTS